MANRIEMELRFIVDVTRPVTELEREMLTNMLETAEDWRNSRGIISNPDIDRVRQFLGGSKDTQLAQLAFPLKKDMDRTLLEAALLHHNGNRTHAAKELGITVRTVRNQIKRLGLNIKAQQCGHNIVESDI